MTRFEAITRSPYLLSEFLYKVQDDALEAEGCSNKLKLPNAEIGMIWEDWLMEEWSEGDL